jgi:hypothetical protein
MIDNVVLLITGTLHERDTHDLLERCHPLGWFDTMPALCVATNVAELYNTVLVETPLGGLWGTIGGKRSAQAHFGTRDALLQLPTLKSASQPRTWTK